MTSPASRKREATQLRYPALIHICNDNSSIVIFPILINLLSALTDRCAHNSGEDEERAFHCWRCGFPADLEKR